MSAGWWGAVTDEQPRDDGLHPPTNVRLVDADGNEHPVQVTFAGMDGASQVYEVVDAPDGPTWTGVHIDVLPGLTNVVVPMSWGVDPDA